MTSLLVITSASAVFAQAQSVPGANWEMVNYGPNGSNSNPQTQITKDNVQYLETKWIYPYTRPAPALKIGEAFGSNTPPLVVDGVVYISMMDRRVLAIDATTGKLIWNNSFGSNFLDRVKITATYPWISAPNAHVHAMSYYRDKGWIIQSALACHSYAIDAKTGKTAWSMTPEAMCGTNQEWGDPRKGIDGTLGRGFMSAQAHPPVFLGNIMFYPIGGGSGSGGALVLVYSTLTNNGTISSNGGTGGSVGSGGNGGANGTTGNAGIIYQVDL